MPLSDLAKDLDVLVVDDEPGIRELLTGYFAARGFRVDGAPDGRAAITLLQRAHGRFGLVVTDLNLPGADGFAVLQAARQANPHCFVVIITGYASLDSAIRAVRVGACDYLTKPFSLGQLDVILSRIRDLHAQERRDDDRSAGRVVEVQPLMPAARASKAPTLTSPATRLGRAAAVGAIPFRPIDAEVVVDAEIIEPETVSALRPDVIGHSPGPDRRLDQLEAAFGRIEALLRDRRP